jgi:hypothetical protein
MLLFRLRQAHRRLRRDFIVPGDHVQGGVPPFALLMAGGWDGHLCAVLARRYHAKESCLLRTSSIPVIGTPPDLKRTRRAFVSRCALGG